MSKFMDLLDEYLELRDDLKDEDNFASIGHRQHARQRLFSLRCAINQTVDSVEQRLYNLEQGTGI